MAQSYVAHDETVGFDPSKVAGSGYNTNTWGKNQPVDTATMASAAPILAQKNDLWGNIGAGGYSAANSALFGLPDFLIKKVGGEQSDAYKYLRRLRDEHKQASQIGDVAGMVGGMFIPGGALLKGGGAALKAIGGAGKLGKMGSLAKAGEALSSAGKFAAGRGGTAGEVIKRGALQGLEQALPRAAVKAADTGDVGGAAQDTLLGTALGGGAAGILGKGIPWLAKQGKDVLKNVLPNKIEEMARGQALTGVGVNMRAIKQSLLKPLNQMGVDEPEQYLNDVVSNLSKKGLWNEEAIKGAVRESSLPFKQAAAVAEKNHISPETLRLDLEKDPIIIEMVNKYGDDATKTLNDLIARSEKSGGFIGTRRYLQERIEEGFERTAKESDKMKGDIAKAIRDKYEDVIAEADPSTQWAKMKNDYRLLQPLKRAMILGDIRPEALFKQGSDTAWKLMGGSALLGGGGAALTGDENTSIAERLAKFGGGAVLGGLGGRAMTSASNAALKRIGGKIIEKGGKILEPGAAYNQVAQELGKKIPEGIKDAAGVIAKASPEMTAKSLGATAGPIANNTLGGQPELDLDNPGNNLSPDMAQTEQAQKLASQAPEVYQDRIMQGLVRDYQGHWANQVNEQTGQPYSFEDVVQMAAQATNGFQPELSARILFQNQGEQGQYQQNLGAAKRLGKINVLDAFAQQSALGRGPKKDKAINDLVQFVGQLTQGDSEKIMSKEKRKLIESDLMKIDKLAISPAQKKALVEQTLEEQYGLNLTGLKELGVI